MTLVRNYIAVRLGQHWWEEISWNRAEKEVHDRYQECNLGYKQFRTDKKNWSGNRWKRSIWPVGWMHIRLQTKNCYTFPTSSEAHFFLLELSAELIILFRFLGLFFRLLDTNQLSLSSESTSVDNSDISSPSYFSFVTMRWRSFMLPTHTCSVSRTKWSTLI